jgi:hypothetical protein
MLLPKLILETKKLRNVKEGRKEPRRNKLL